MLDIIRQFDKSQQAVPIHCDMKCGAPDPGPGCESTRDALISGKKLENLSSACL
jgi:hypothetical protein